MRRLPLPVAAVGDTGLERRCGCPHLIGKWGQFCFYSSSPAWLGFPSSDEARLSAKLSVFYV